MDIIEKNKITFGLIIVAAVALVLFGVTYKSNGNNSSNAGTENNNENIMEQDFPTTNNNNPVVVLKTSLGDISLELYADRTPITAENFIKLAEEGFYTNTKFHRVINNFMIQGGDPNSRSDDVTTYGRGGPDYTIEDEFDPELSNLRGTIAMANIGQPNSGGSQFFINHINNVGLDFDKQPLTSKHPIFGHVIEGMDVVDAIAKTAVGLGDIPVEAVIIEDVLVSRSENTGEDNQAIEEENTEVDEVDEAEENINDASNEEGGEQQAEESGDTSEDSGETVEENTEDAEEAIEEEATQQNQ